MALLTAYAKLQLDPNDHARMAAFEALCWHHILNHGSRDWADACWNGFIKLQLWTSKTSSTQGFKGFDGTLDRLVFELVHAYATTIWPAGDTKRSHLAIIDKKYHGMELKASQWQLNVGNGIKQRFKATQDLDLNETDAMVESKIGQRVRAYLMNLLLFKQPSPHIQSADAGKLLQIFLKPQTSRKRAHSKPASAATGVSTMDDLHVPSKRNKEEQQSSQKKPSQLRYKGAIRERSIGLVRLRFTFSGTKRLQSITSRPSKPAADYMKGSGALHKARDLVSTSSGTRKHRRKTATHAYQCWLRSCGEVFQTTQEVLLHVIQKHRMENRELMTMANPSNAVADNTSQRESTASRPALHVEDSDVEILEVRAVPKQTASIRANALLQSLQDTEKAGFTFNDEYVAMVNRYARW
ncbi:hypothetical protein Q7P35_012507 [Cladosporium inversicolor]